MVDHEQVEIEVRPGLRISVDKGLEKIIMRLWAWDIETDNSCIDNNGKVWIAFASFFDVRLFTTMIFLSGYKSVNVVWSSSL